MGEDGIRNGERESERRTDADATLKMMKKNLHSARDFISPDYAKRARNSESQQQLQKFILGDAIKRGRGGRQGRTQNALAIVYRSGGKHAAAGSIGNSKSFHRTPKYDV